MIFYTVPRKKTKKNGGLPEAFLRFLNTVNQYLTAVAVMVTVTVLIPQTLTIL